VSEDVVAAAESVARLAYGRLVASLSCKTKDIAAAEDALSEAFAEALQKWPAAGVPDSPAGWILTVARRRLIDVVRKESRQDKSETIETMETLMSPPTLEQTEPFQDDRLRLMFVCTHPAIDITVRSALMLQTVLGLEAKTIATAFNVASETMAKRLVRAKHRIRETGIPFEVPEAEQLESRLSDVIEAIYAAYFLAREVPDGTSQLPTSLSKDSIQLARVLCQLVPDEAEPLGLLALMLFCEARRTSDSKFVPLLEQDTARWDGELMREGYQRLADASKLGTPGPYQIEAAIHAAHCYRARSGSTPWKEIANLYDQLISHGETMGVAVSRAVAHAYAAEDASVGLAILADMPERETKSFQPWWAAKAHLLEQLGKFDHATDCFRCAAELATRPEVRDYLLSRPT